MFSAAVVTKICCCLAAAPRIGGFDMGYLVAAHIVKSKPDTAKLSALPSSIEWSLHQADETGKFYIDTYKTGRQQTWPFTSMPPTKDISLDFAPGLESLAV